MQTAEYTTLVLVKDVKADDVERVGNSVWGYEYRTIVKVEKLEGTRRVMITKRNADGNVYSIVEAINTRLIIVTK